MGLQIRVTAPSFRSSAQIALPEDADLEKSLPDHEEFSSSKDHPPHKSSRRRISLITILLSDAALLGLVLYLFVHFNIFDFPFPSKPSPLPSFVVDGIKQCKINARGPPSPKPFTKHRKYSDRFVEGTGAVWLKNATLWTGEDDGEEVLRGVGVLLDGGVIRKIGSEEELQAFVKGDVEELELDGAWVTPGIVDLHSHMGNDPSPELRGTADTNSLKSAILPWLRSLDGVNTHNEAYNLSIAGGITTMLVLPGSAGNIGGQAFVFKPRWTYENTPQAMQVDPPFVIGSDDGGWERTESWRHIKHACGENPSRVFGNTRMDSAHDFRRAYDEGRQLKLAQDRWCEDPEKQTEPFPNNDWEVLADVIRGNVKVNIHCYETTDLNSMVRISNEFKFPIAAFHHAHETYLVPDLLKQAYGPVPPAVAIFATNARYKREAYRGSEYAPKILADNGLSVIMKSDHPVLDSRYLIFEAAQAHHYGLNFSQALGSVTTHSAKAMGMDHRLGYIREGYDADIVVWDSFPLTLGATPKQTYIDGIPQIIKPAIVSKPAEAQEISPAGKWDKEAAEALAARGDPDLRPKKQAANVVFEGVAAIYLPMMEVEALNKGDRVVITNGEVSCVGECLVSSKDDYELVNLKGGALTQGLISVGSYLGLIEIRQEKATHDGSAYDPVSGGDELIDGLLVRGVDGAQFGGKDELIAYRAGVTAGVGFPIVSGGASGSLFAGLSFAFSTSGAHPLAKGAILNPAAALHLALDNSKISTSTKIGILRRLLQGKVEEETEVTEALQKVAKGELRLVVDVNKADIIAALVRLKKEVAPKMKLTLLGAAESWMLAEELAEENIGVVVTRPRSFPATWDSRRIVPGLPLSNHSLASYLADAGVLVGLGIEEEWEARNTRLEAAWTYANSPSVFTKSDALSLVSKNLEELLGLEDGVKARAESKSWVAWEGDVFGFEGRVKAIRAQGADHVDMI
ncbi:hypothetical protein BCR39DRAFT_509101 [Naematelia encephala]|uniref:Amidohydrolase-related domain-containing protein n=1 Tax=Naematelia encephala TaxID=71784 RepID=A0A1Y2BKR1_9TREE|nr:hypothetical protein BCR39DRAFT_509101 [Naematelia encephala]